LIVVELQSTIVAGEKIALTAIAKIGKATLSSPSANVSGSSGGGTKAAAIVGAVKKHHDSSSFSMSLCLSISLSLLSLSLSYLSFYLASLNAPQETNQKQQQHL
jgi:hypothetical protein